MSIPMSIKSFATLTLSGLDPLQTYMRADHPSLHASFEHFKLLSNKNNNISNSLSLFFSDSQTCRAFFALVTSHMFLI